MRYFNSFYIAFLLSGLALFFVLKPDNQDAISFYGFAESNETEINYNYPIVVEKILAVSGQEVLKGDTLMHISRRKTKEVLEDQQYRIGELKAEEAIWITKKRQEGEELKLTLNNKLIELDQKINQVENELAYKKSLNDNLTTITPNSSSHKPLVDKMDLLINEKKSLNEVFKLKMEGLNREIKMGNSPYREQIKRLSAEHEFELSQLYQALVVTAPSDGLVGNISCKEEEHIPSFTTLMSFYEPHSGIITGFVHEKLTLKVHIGDKFKISSLTDESINYTGEVTGLGSRIVEIPSRLRKIPLIKSYGREVVIKIPKENSFLQKEKVGVSYLTSDLLNNE